MQGVQNQPNLKSNERERGNNQRERKRFLAWFALVQAAQSSTATQRIETRIAETLEENGLEWQRRRDWQATAPGEQPRHVGDKPDSG